MTRPCCMRSRCGTPAAHAAGAGQQERVIPCGSSATEILCLLDVYSPNLLIYIYENIYIEKE